MAHGRRLTLPRGIHLDDQAIETIGSVAMFVISFAFGWLVMLWAWGGWVGGLMGWIPALVLAAILAPIWRMVLAGGATVALLLMVVRIL